MLLTGDKVTVAYPNTDTNTYGLIYTIKRV